jgi:hypothetical protein
MARDKDSYSRSDDRKPSAGRVERRTVPDNRPQARRIGHSGYGVESIRPILRAQIEERNLLRPPFPPADDPFRPRRRKDD